MMKPAIIEQIGGEEVVQKLVDQFYDIIETHPDGNNILHLHMSGHGISHARQQQMNFLCGFLGGRNYYLEVHKNMNIKEMHAHVPIRMDDAINWLKCMDQAMEKIGLIGAPAHRMREAFRKVAITLVNDIGT